MLITFPAFQWTLKNISLGVKQSKADRLHKSNIEVNAWSYTATPQYVCMA